MKWTFQKWAALIIIVSTVLFIIFSQASKPRVSPEIKEGPHLFYKDGLWKAITLKVQGKRYLIDTTTFLPENLSEEEVRISVPGSDQFFSMKVSNNHSPPPFRYDSQEKLIVISDVEGDFNYLETILKGNAVIDDEFRWIFGKGHLVVLGDVFDRGKNVTECLWLIYKLEQEAQKMGGMVHFILGNHEVMNLHGDHRYVVKKYKRMSDRLTLEYKDFYANNTILGSWLRSKNAVEVIGETLFAHGGISGEVTAKGLSLESINQTIRTYLDVPPKHYKDPMVKLMMGGMGPLWYRGYADLEVTDEEISQTLALYQVNKMVIGHTVFDDVKSLYDNRVFVIDVSRKDKNHLALLIENGEFYKIDSAASKTKL